MFTSVRRSAAIRKRAMWQPFLVLSWMVAIAASVSAQDSGDTRAADDHEIGRQIYQLQCAKCHGSKGEGVADVYDEVLSGDHSVDALTRIIDETMPEETPEDCVGDNARQAAGFIHAKFYSLEARRRNQPLRVELSHLTVRQYRMSLADLLDSDSLLPVGTQGTGLRARYYDDRSFKHDKMVFDRTDPQVDLSFADASPDEEKIDSEAFSIRWEGSVIARETGEYEFSVTSENGFRLWVNNPQDALIDAWVSSGEEPREQTVTLFLLGGRAYPIRLHFFKYKEKSASIQLAWRPPFGVREIIPASQLLPKQVSETLVVSSPLPPDDSSQGYARGTSISKAWDEATTYAAIEVANYVAQRIDALAHTKPDDEQRRSQIQAFCHRFAERAFRRPLTDAQQEFFVDRRFDEVDDLDTGLKRSVLLILKSPRFLYPGIGSPTMDGYTIASRLALTMWDSLPDDALEQAAASGQLQTAQQVSDQARRMLLDARAHSKVRDFFHHWLEVDKGNDISRDANTFHGFDEEVVADLRTSLDLFIDDVVWSDASDFRRLLLDDRLFLNARLADFYDVQIDAGGSAEFQNVAMDEEHRAGIVTHPYLLTTFAYYRSTSPIHRGVFVTRKLLGRSLKPPPMAIEFKDSRFDPELTMREKVSELTGPAACQTCHRVINPLGFSLENFDAVGRYRTMDMQKPIDAGSIYTTEEGDLVELNGARDLAEFAAGNPRVHLGFVAQMFQQVVKQPIGAYGPSTLDDLHDSFAESHYNIQSLLVEIAKTVSLRSAPSGDAKERNDDE